MTYRSTGIRADGDHFLRDGEPTLKGVTLPVPPPFRRSSEKTGPPSVRPLTAL
jgi:hypothetical protein